MRQLYITTLTVFLASLIDGGDSEKRTVYGCEGSNLNLSCEEGLVIQLVRANYGRFSISICNQEGNTAWSVNCMEPRSLRVINTRCGGLTQCSVPVSSSLFGDPCPGTSKYVEVHYTCSLPQPVSSPTTTSLQPRPPWLLDLSATPENNWNTWLTSTSSSTSSTRSTTSSTTIVTTTTTFTTVSSSRVTEVMISSTESNDVTISSVPSVTALSVTESQSERNIQLTGSLTEERLRGCPPLQSRGLYWARTQAGDESRQPCPPGSDGEAVRRCGVSPDLSHCQSHWVSSLLARMSEGEAEDRRLAEELASLTSSRPLYGGDLSLITSMMEALARWSEAVQSTASSMLADRQEAAWRDLPPAARLETAVRLMAALQHSALLLAQRLGEEEERLEVSHNIISSVRVMGAADLDTQTFPSTSLDHVMEGAEISVSANTLNQLRVNGAVRIIFFLYTSLDQWLVPHTHSDDDLNFLNSRVVSVLVTAGRSVRVSEPIKLTLQHIVTGGGSGLCVRWEVITRTWSEDSCLVSSSNTTHTECQCHHLGDFALIMKETSSEETGSLVWSIIGAFVSVLVGVLVTVLISCIIRRLHLKTGGLGCLHCKRGSKTDGPDCYPTISCSPTSTTLSGTPTTITTMESNYFLHSECGPPPPPAQEQPVKSIYQLEPCQLHPSVIPVTELEVRDLRSGYLRPISPLGHIYMEIDPVYSRHHHHLAEEELRRPLIRNTLRRTVATPGLRSQHHPPITIALSQAGEHYVSLNLDQRSQTRGYRTGHRPVGPQ